MCFSLKASARSSRPATLCGYTGRLSTTDSDPLDSPLYLLWQTNPRLVQSAVSLPLLACDVADLYHLRRVVRLPELPGLPLEVV